jgi:hypothetical protein
MAAAVTYNGPYVLLEGKGAKGDKGMLISIKAEDLSADGTAALVMLTARSTADDLSQWYIVRYLTKADLATPFMISLPTRWWQLLHLPGGTETPNADIGKIIGSKPGNPPPVHPDDEPPPGIVTGPGHI